jgi:hypothetical protein
MKQLQTLAASLLLLTVGIFTGSALQSPPAALGQAPPRQTFQSGGQLAVPVLKEIAATLQKVDARLARLEAIANQMQKPGN